MKILVIPAKLRNALLSFLLCLPLVFIQFSLSLKTWPWLVPVGEVRPWLLLTVSILAPLALLIAFGVRLTIWAVIVAAAVWVLGTLFLAIRETDLWMGFFFVSLTLYWVGTISAFKIEFERSYLCPGVKWYQGLPKEIPGLSCKIKTGEKDLRLKVCRMDRDGIFVFLNKIQSDGIIYQGLNSESKLALELEFEGLSVPALGRPVSKLKTGFGLGMQFEKMTADSEKEIGDFLEQLRGKGYVG